VFAVVVHFYPLPNIVVDVIDMYFRLYQCVFTNRHVSKVMVNLCMYLYL
jgi:hypothetical protein